MKENEVGGMEQEAESEERRGSEPAWGSPTKDHAVSSAPAAQTRGGPLS